MQVLVVAKINREIQKDFKIEKSIILKAVIIADRLVVKTKINYLVAKLIYYYQILLKKTSFSEDFLLLIIFLFISD